MREVETVFERPHCFTVENKQKEVKMDRNEQLRLVVSIPKSISMSRSFFVG